MFGRKRGGKRAAVPLDEAVRTVAGCPCPEHQEAFATALAAADALLLMVMGSAGPVPEHDAVRTVEEGDQIQVATAIAPNGRSFLHAFTDLEAGRARFPEAAFVGVAPQVAFRMCLANGNEGLLVTASGDDDPWAALTADGVVRLRQDR